MVDGPSSQWKTLDVVFFVGWFSFSFSMGIYFNRFGKNMLPSKVGCNFNQD